MSVKLNDNEETKWRIIFKQNAGKGIPTDQETENEINPCLSGTESTGEPKCEKFMYQVMFPDCCLTEYDIQIATLN